MDGDFKYQRSDSVASFTLDGFEIDVEMLLLGYSLVRHFAPLLDTT